MIYLKDMRLFLFLLFFIVVNLQPTYADEKAAIAKAESYLQELGTARARFVQTAPSGAQFVGTFYLDRPGKLRFDYDPPLEDFIVADGLFIHFYDGELEEQTSAPINQTFAHFFLRDDLTLSGDLTVSETRRTDEELQLKIVQTKEPEEGTLTLYFKEEPFSLSQWTIEDAQGLTTRIELFYLKTGMTHPGGLFVYQSPKGQKRYND